MVVAVLVCFGSITVIMVVMDVAVAMVMEARLVVVMVVSSSPRKSSITVSKEPVELIWSEMERSSRPESRPKFSVGTSAKSTLKPVDTV